MTSEDAILCLKGIKNYGRDTFTEQSDWQDSLDLAIKALEQEPKIGHCKDCKWWKDSDGAYRRGCEAESQCPMNRIEVFEGNGYCYLYEPQESEVEDGSNN